MTDDENVTQETANSEDLDVNEIANDETEIKEAQSSDAENQMAILKDQLARVLADHDNYKRRTAKEYSLIIQNANEKLMTEILPVVDDMERALKVSKELQSEDVKIQQFVQGFGFIYQKMMKTLTDKGLKVMESIGKPLNPELHDALMQIDRPDIEPNTIVDEHERGYFLYEKVIRHAKVMVSKSN